MVIRIMLFNLQEAAKLVESESKPGGALNLRIYTREKRI